MTILLSNDDGIEAPGLYDLAACLAEFDRVVIVAPAFEQSGVGHAITFREPLRVLRLDEKPRGVRRLAVEGTPADAVKFALRHELDELPALVVTGPNTGPNVGVNVLYSGTVAAAYEANFWGVSSVAVSSDLQEAPWDFSACCHFAREVVGEALEMELHRRRHPESRLRHGEARPFLLNLNVPARPLEAIGGLRVTRHGSSGFSEFFVPHEGGDPDHFRIRGEFEDNDPGDDYDAAALVRGCATLTPLSFELTDPEMARRLGGRWE
jgi:5'-nucleotidase